MTEQVNIVKLIKACMGMEGETDVELITLDSIMPISGYINKQKCKDNFELFVNHISKLPKVFLDSEQGGSFVNLVFYAGDNERGVGNQWGCQDDAAQLCLICSYFGIFQDPIRTLGFDSKYLKDLPGGVSYVSFNIEPEFLNLVRNNLELK